MSPRVFSTPQYGAQHIVGEKFRIIRKIGGGSFGDVYLGVNICNGEEIAIKLEKANDVEEQFIQLKLEHKVYSLLSGGVSIPRIHYFKEAECVFGDCYNVLVMDLLGPSLESLFNRCSRQFSMKTVLMLAEQMVGRVEFLHKRNYIHRDIKSENFLMGTGAQKNCVYLIDFGLSKKFVDMKTGVHIRYREDRGMVGTVRFSSLKSHLGSEQSRRDDMEAIGYVLLYFCRGNLPWQGLKASTMKQKYEMVSEMKMSTSLDELGKGFPDVFVKYLKYCRNLDFPNKPDYGLVCRMFRDTFKQLNYQYDSIFDWMVASSSDAAAPRQQNVITEGEAAAAGGGERGGGAVSQRQGQENSVILLESYCPQRQPKSHRQQQKALLPSIRKQINKNIKCNHCPMFLRTLKEFDAHTRNYCRYGCCQKPN